MAPDCAICDDDKGIIARLNGISRSADKNRGMLAVICGVGAVLAIYAFASFASNDKVEAVDRRVSDVKDAMQSGFDRMEVKQERILDMLIKDAGDK